MKTREKLGLRIKELRKLRGLTQEKLSEMVGIEPKHLSRIEVGGSYPSLDTLERIAIALNADMKDFFEFDHHGKSARDIKRSINALLDEADQERLRTILKVVSAIVK